MVDRCWIASSKINQIIEMVVIKMLIIVNDCNDDTEDLRNDDSGD